MARRNNNSIHTDMKNKVLRWLLAHSQHLINNSRFPLGEVCVRHLTLSQQGIRLPTVG
jgi:hypothetical protein